VNKLFQILMLLLVAPYSQAQPDSLPLVRRFQTDVTQLAVDNLDNIYIIASTGQLKKYNAAGDSMGAYSQGKRFGKLQAIDVTNPLELLLFYKDFSTVVLLDRFLAVRTAIDLRKQHILQTTAAGLSYDGNVWLFDAYENKLKKIKEDGTLVLETPDFRTLFPDAIAPQQILDQNGTVYVYDPQTGLYLFDYYGAFKKKLPITGWQYLAVWEQYITGIQGSSLQYFNTATMLSGARKLPVTTAPAANLQWANNKIFLWNASSVSLYNYPL
jgi:hypothetical protein